MAKRNKMQAPPEPVPKPELQRLVRPQRPEVIEVIKALANLEDAMADGSLCMTDKTSMYAVGKISTLERSRLAVWEKCSDRAAAPCCNVTLEECLKIGRCSECGYLRQAELKRQEIEALIDSNELIWTIW